MSREGDVVDRGLGLWLRQFGKAIQHVHRFVLPAPLVTGLGVNLIHGRPEAHGTVSDSQFWGIHSPALEAEKNFAPALSGHAHPVNNRQEPFLATRRHANNHKGAELVILASKAAVDAVRCPAGACKTCCREGAEMQTIGSSSTAAPFQPSYSLAQSRLLGSMFACA